MIFSYTKNRYFKLLTAYSDLVLYSKQRALYDSREIERLREEVRSLKKQIKIKDEALHRKNIDMDTLHYVWCNGTCKGVHIYDTQTELTEEQATSFFRNVYRILCKFNLSKFAWTSVRNKEFFEYNAEKVYKILAGWVKKDNEN